MIFIGFFVLLWRKMIPFHSLAVNASPSILTLSPNIIIRKSVKGLQTTQMCCGYFSALLTFALLPRPISQYFAQVQWHPLSVNQPMAATTCHWNTPPERFQKLIICESVSSNYRPQFSNKSRINRLWLPAEINCCLLFPINYWHQLFTNHYKSPAVTST